MTKKPLEDAIAERLAHQQYDSIYSLWQKALSRLEDDRDGSVTAARTLIETTVKMVLDELKVPHNETWDLPKLYHEAASELGLSPKQHTDVLLRSIFGAAQTIVNSVGEMRNKLGDAHGKGNLSFPVPRRHAELAINLAGSICCFLVSALESTIAAKKLITSDGNVILKFNVAAVWRLVDHARTSKRSMTFYGKRLRKRSLCLVGDAGVYLISNGLPAMDEKGNLITKRNSVGIRRLIALAAGCDPAYNAFEDWWAIHNAIDGGNDFSIPIPIEEFEEILPSCKSQIVMRINPKGYEILSDVELERSL